MKCLPATDLIDAVTRLDLNPVQFADGRRAVLDAEPIPCHLPRV